MRSELVAQASGHVKNPFLLVHVASVLTRKFHRPTKDRVPESINRCLAGIGEGKYILAFAHGSFPECVVASSCKEPQLFVATPEVWDFEPTPEERIAVSSALIEVTDQLAEIA